MVQVRYSRYRENRRTFKDKYGPDPRPGREHRLVALCRECGKPRQGRFHFYCSTEHKEKWETENVPDGWGDMRDRILKRDHHACTNCGTTKATLDARAQAERNYERHRLEVDHIKPVKLFPELEYEPSNLRTLCHECHVLIGERPSAKSVKRHDQFKHMRTLGDFGA